MFISSVFRDMLALRDLAGEAAKLVGLEPVLTEDLVAQAGPFKSLLGIAIHGLAPHRLYSSPRPGDSGPAVRA
ncbi:MAG TPA: hypothetical protein VLX28_21255 [Thermoanaerobaculia bacterium]|nr:hypothetical protein [Thermoanaerobaculia bacterium]